MSAVVLKFEPKKQPVRGWQAHKQTAVAQLSAEAKQRRRVWLISHAEYLRSLVLSEWER
jgi:hypothetical protein